MLHCIHVCVCGYVSTESSGFILLQEYFFVPYTFTDVNDEREIHKGDEVSFYMAKNKRSVHNDKSVLLHTIGYSVHVLL